MKPLRVMSFNIRHARGMNGEVSLQNIVAEIQSSGTDIIGLQEVDRFLPRSNTADQPAELARLLEMNVYYSASEDRHNTSNAAAYIRENDAKSGLDGQYGNAILSRFPIASHQFQYLPGNSERRSLLQTEIEIDGRRLTFFDTHLGVSDEDQTVQIDAIIEALKSTSGAFILLGDFNMEPENPLLAKLSSVAPKVLLEGNVTTFAGEKDAVVEIDHIFTNLKPETDTAWTQPTEASDHHPVLAQLFVGAGFPRPVSSI